MNPGCEGFPVELTTGNRKNDPLLFVYRTAQFIAVEDENGFKCRMPCAFVAIHEGVVLNKKKSHRSGLLRKGWVEFLICEDLEWLEDRRFESALIANAARSAALFDDPPVDFDDLGDRDETHLGQPPIQLSVLLDDVINRPAELCIALKFLFNAVLEQLLDRESAELRGFLDPGGNFVGNVEFQEFHGVRFYRSPNSANEPVWKYAA